MEDELVIFAVFDSFGGFLGYKTDVLWTLDKEKKNASALVIKTVLSEDFVAKNLASLLNDSSWWRKNIHENQRFDDKETIYMVVEEQKTGEGLFGYILYKDDIRYRLLKNP